MYESYEATALICILNVFRITKTQCFVIISLNHIEFNQLLQLCFVCVCVCVCVCLRACVRMHLPVHADRIKSEPNAKIPPGVRC